MELYNPFNPYTGNDTVDNGLIINWVEKWVLSTYDIDVIFQKPHLITPYIKTTLINSHKLEDRHIIWMKELNILSKHDWRQISRYQILSNNIIFNYFEHLCLRNLIIGKNKKSEQFLELLIYENKIKEKQWGVLSRLFEKNIFSEKFVLKYISNWDMIRMLRHRQFSKIFLETYVSYLRDDDDITIDYDKDILAEELQVIIIKSLKEKK